MKTNTLTIGMAAAVALLSNANAAVVYTEDFSVSSESSASSVGWSYYEEATGEDRSTTTRWGGGDTGIDENIDTFLMKGNSTPGQEHLLVTSEPGAHAVSQIAGVQSVVGVWRNRNDATDPVFRIAIKAGDTWYASSTSVTIDASNAPGDDNLTDGNQLASVLSVDFSSEVWMDLNFAAGTSLSLGGVASSQPGATDMVTEYGIFLSSHDLPQWMGVDDFQLSTVPEPSSAALLGLGGLSLVMRRRK